MTNEGDEFEHELGHEAEDLNKTGMRANLINAWRSQPLVKLLVLMVIVAAVVGVTFSLLSGNSSERKSMTSVGAPPHLNEPPGGAASPYVKEQTIMASKQREEDAQKNGGSAIPTPLGGEVIKDDPLKELKQQIDALTREVNKPKPTPAPTAAQPVQVQQPEQFDDSLARAMQKQMNDLSSSWGSHTLKQVTVSASNPPGASGSAPEFGAGHPVAGYPPVNGASAVPLTPSKILVPAGTVSYAKLLTQANSDVPGPILAEIVTGPLAGARAVGSFTVANNYNDYLVLNFSLAELKGKEYVINTLALDPNTNLGGLATEVDERYFDRVLLPAAASFLQGFGGALSNTGSSVTTNGTTTIVSQGQNGIRQGLYNGASSAANTAGQFFQNQANNTKPLIVVAAGTPMGILFVTSLTDAPPPPYPGYPNNGYPNGYPNGYAGYSGFPGTGFPGTGVPGVGFPSGFPTGILPQSPFPGAPNGTQGYGGYPQAQNAPYGNNSNQIYGNAPYGYTNQTGTTGTSSNYINLTGTGNGITH